MARKASRGTRVIQFIETYCLIPEGEHVGQPVVLAPFQKKFIKAVYDNTAITDTAILSIGRKNAKTGLIAFLMLAHLVGPEAKQNSRIVSGAMSREQAAEVYNLASKCVQLSEDLSDIIRIVPSSKKLVGLPMNVEYQAISAEGRTAHGKSPIVAILDEIGQVRGPKSDFVDAITTAQGAYKNPLLIYISTQAANDSDLFSLLIDDALRNKPRKTVCHVYAADPDCKLTDKRQWKKANPALGKFRSLADVKKQAEKAERMPSFEATFRNLVLNQRVELFNPFVSKNVWLDNAETAPPMVGMQLYGGLDLSSRTDLTAMVLVGQVGEKIAVYPFFWTPGDGVRDRCDRDRQPYDVWIDQGHMKTTPGATVDYDFVVKDLMEIITDGDNELVSIAFDRWRINDFKKSMDSLGVSFPLVEHGQGFRDMSPALDTLEAYLLNKQIMHGSHPVLTMCAANATVEQDAAGNRKLNKQRATGRIDGMVALAMALRAMKSGETDNRVPVSPWENENFSLMA